MLIAAEKISKSYSKQTLLNDISLYIDKGDKIGVIGANGAGKSTLLRLLAQADEPDSGTVTKYSGVRLEYMPQNPIWSDELTVLEHVFRHAPALRESKEYEAKKILTKLGITDFDKPVGSLSGGQRKCMEITSTLIQPCDVLLLDEPTNHLDTDMVQWLESYLIRYQGAIVMVTHDRYFLDRIVNKIVEIDGGCLYSYPANYSAYLELKAQREEMALGSERIRQSILRKEIEWIQRGPRARGTKSKGRIARFEALNEKSGLTEPTKFHLTSSSSRLGKKTIEINDISKSFGGKLLISHFSHVLLRDDRIGIIGKSGSGKSTLLNIIAGRLKPDAGTVAVGDTVKLGYYTQASEDLDLNVRVIDYLKEVIGATGSVDGTLSPSQMLEESLFTAEQQWNTIGRLSGGERKRLYLLGILAQAPNVLLLDEPTNDLDIQTLVILEEYLEDFKGAVIAVSHDRYFLDKVADTIFAFRGNGEIKKYLGSYSDYWDQNAKETDHVTIREPAEKPRNNNEKKLKFSFNEQREFECIESEIKALEEELEGLNRLIEGASSDYIRLEEYLAQKNELDKKLESKMERWVYLTELSEKIAGTHS